MSITGAFRLSNKALQLTPFRERSNLDSRRWRVSN